MRRVEKPEVLVFGSASCMSSQWVRRELHARQASYAYVDFQDFDRRGSEIYFQSGSGGDEVLFSDLATDRTVSTAGLRSAYFREMAPKSSLWQLDPLRVRKQDVPDAEGYHWEQVLRFSSSILEYLGRRCFCLYPKAVTGQAANKLRQLEMARELGFRIPETYVGRDLEEMRAFVREVGRVISKPFYPQNLFYQGDNYKTYTSLFTLADLEPFAETRYPVLLQEAVADKVDIRVGIVGQKVFATEIRLPESDEGETILDFRHFVVLDTYDRQGGARYQAHDLPEPVRERCLGFARASGLQYAMIDLLLTPGGEYVFLECNTKGMHGEVEYGGHDVIGAVVDLLLDPDANKLV